METEEAAAANSKRTASILPFVQGGLTGLLASSVSFLANSVHYNFGYQLLSSKDKANFVSYFKKFPARLFINTTTTTAQLGSFMYLKQRSEAANCGRPLNLYQEACCGMAAGATFAFFGSPLYLASRRIETNGALISVQRSYFRNLMLDLSHTAMDKGVLALWRGGGPYTVWAIGHNTGMLASYDRSVRYFEDSCGLSKSYSQLGGAIVSGIFASACGISCEYINYASKLLRNDKNYQGKSFLECALRSWELCGNKILYKGFLDLLSKNTPSLVIYPADFLISTMYATAVFGSFKTLKQRLEAANCGRPLSIYQEASCGMAAGATGALFTSPIYLACQRIEANAGLMSANQSIFRSLLLELSRTARDKGVLVIWRGGGYYTYGRSVSYYKDSCDLSKFHSQLRAGIVSGFFASACSLPCMNIYTAFKFVRNNEKFQCNGFVDIVLKVLEKEGPKIFYKGFSGYYTKTWPQVVLLWLSYEFVREKLSLIRS